MIQKMDNTYDKVKLEEYGEDSEKMLTDCLENLLVSVIVDALWEKTSGTDYYER